MHQLILNQATDALKDFANPDILLNDLWLDVMPESNYKLAKKKK